MMEVVKRREEVPKEELWGEGANFNPNNFILSDHVLPPKTTKGQRKAEQKRRLQNISSIPVHKIAPVEKEFKLVESDFPEL